ncbi:alpha-galactosidase [Lacticaseibacillus jixiensis]|uniref:alpha-galactosidase n=1 Tax=Lacticaseibacillus jixiensis TaxID=3231926 RepID=UPI0036F1B6B1
MITYDAQTKQFELATASTMMVLQVLPSGHLVTLYYGAKFVHGDLSGVLAQRRNAPYMAELPAEDGGAVELLPITYPTYGHPDLRNPAVQVTYADGERISDLRYASHTIQAGKKALHELPSSHAQGQVATLTITLKDQCTGLVVQLILSAFADYDVITQSVKITNEAKQPIVIDRAYSLNLSLLSADYDLLLLSGAYGREFQQQRHALHQGFQGIDSLRGASGHGQNPFAALAAPQTDEMTGEVYGCSLMYSGNFYAGATVDMHHTTRLQLGIADFGFQWQLAPDATFETPEAVLVFADHGLNQMSQRFHRFILDCVMNSPMAHKPRPILLNNWEATYFHFDRPKLLALAEVGRRIGCELFVLDDGWFGQRDADNCALGDWTPNTKKLGGSLKSLAESIKAIGLDFGLWIEPEMISKQSRLYTQHPDWVLGESRHPTAESRHQWVLDLSRTEIQDFIIDTVSQLLHDNPITYVKWDMNRNITDVCGGFPQDITHRYILGLYRVLRILTARYPAVLFESCAGGGGRFDTGMLAYTPQIWTSDDTDAMARLAIQEGASLVYPPVAIGAHVSESPNQQTGRRASLKLRGAVAQAGNLGYELDLTKLSEAELTALEAQTDYYKAKRQLLQYGIHWRLITDANAYAWQKQWHDQGLVTYVQKRARVNDIAPRLRLCGLKAQGWYRIDDEKALVSGAQLMHIGLVIPAGLGDNAACVWQIQEVEHG